MRHFTRTIFLAALCSFALTAGAKVKLPALVGDDMVLQRNTTVGVWGWAVPGATVRVTPSWNGKTYTARVAADSTWKVQVPTGEAGGPYQVTITDGTPIVLKNVMLGEVWVCSGQSNMEMPMKGFPGQMVIGSNQAIVESGKYKNIRLFTVARAQSKTPLADCSGQWKVASPASVVDFSATAYYFGRNLADALDVPIGLINTSWGGSWIEAWMSEESFSGVSTARHNVSQTLMYNAMILPAVNYTIAGFIWYQGEANQGTSQNYEELMARMIALWRERWGNPDLPFYYAQIAPYVYGGVSETSSALLREQQLKAMNSIPNTGMAVLLDQGDRTNIHPANKQVVGERLSYWALAKIYGVEGIAYRSPEFKSMTVDGDKVAVEFDYAPNGLWPWDVPVDGFELAGENGVFFPATAWIDSNVPRTKVFVRSNQVRAPKYVRYGFWNYVSPDLELLYSTGGLPVSSFRTDKD